MAVIDLAVPGSDRAGRVYLDRDLLTQVTVSQLERHLRDHFIDPEDTDRMSLIEALLRQQETLDVAVFPGEESPPVYYAYIKDPGDPDTRLFACVLAPEPVVNAMIDQSHQPTFETATFQVMSADTAPADMRRALETWARRVWPELRLPALTVRPWPIEEVHSRPPPSPAASPAFVPRNAPALLDASDYPLPEELSA
jgi:hypothetical protein